MRQSSIGCIGRLCSALVVCISVVPLASASDHDQSWWRYTITVPAEITPNDVHVTFNGTGGTIDDVAVTPPGVITVTGGNTIEVNWAGNLTPGTVVSITFSTTNALATVAGGNWTKDGDSIGAIAPGDEDLFEEVDIVAGSDGWTTAPGTVASEFCSTCPACPTPPCEGNPIPLDFFGPGSDVFDNVILLEGDPLDEEASGTIDTIIERLNDAVLLGCPSEDIIQIEIVALSLVSSEPITVTFNGGQDPQAYDVRVCLSDCHFLQLPDPACPALQAGDLVGGMTIQHNCPAGGTFGSTLPVSAKFIFTPVGGGPELILDTGLEGVPPRLLEPAVPTDWVHDAGGLAPPTVPAGLQVDGNCDGVDGPALRGTSNFVPGLAVAPCECDTPPDPCRALHFTTEQAQLAAHGVLPGVPEDTFCCCPDGACVEVDDIAVCILCLGGTVLVGDGASCDEGELGDCEIAGEGCVLTSRCCCEFRGGEWSDPTTTECDAPPCPPLPTCAIPTVSEWGLIVMALLALTAGTIVFARRRRPAVA